MTTLPYREVIVGTDGSPTATAAVRVAATVAVRLGLPLAVATAWYRERPDAPPASEEARYPGGSAASNEASWATDTTAHAAGIARAIGVDEVRQHTPVGAPAEALLDLADGRPGALIVVGTAGLDRRAERIVGNVPHQLTHHATRDLLLVDSVESDDEPGSWATVALATDGSDTATRACAAGLAVARALGATATLLTVARDEARGQTVLDRTAAALDGGDALDRRVVTGDIAGALTAAGAEYDLLVLGNKGMSGPSRLLGSVSNKVTHDVPTDLLLVNTSP